MIEGATLKMLNEVFIKNINIMSTIKNVISQTIKVTDVQEQLEKYNLEQEQLEIQLSELVDLKLNNHSFSDKIFNEKYQIANEKLSQVTKVIDKLEKENFRNFDTTARLNKINSILSKQKKELTEIDSSTLKSFVYKIISVSPEEIIFCVTGTKNYSDSEFVSKISDFMKQVPIEESIYHNDKYSKDMAYKVIII